MFSLWSKVTAASAQSLSTVIEEETQTGPFLEDLAELQIRGNIEDNSEIIFLISQ